jgi:cytochrome P450
MSGESWKDIYGHAVVKKFPKHDYYIMRKDAQPLSTAEDKDYSRQRAALAHGFSERAITGQEATLLRHIDGFIEKLKETTKDNKNVDISKWMEFLTFDIVGEFTLSVQFGCVGNSQNRKFCIRSLLSILDTLRAETNSFFGDILLLYS